MDPQKNQEGPDFCVDDWVRMVRFLFSYRDSENLNAAPIYMLVIRGGHLMLYLGIDVWWFVETQTVSESFLPNALGIRKSKRPGFLW